jgi:hypothetical protein
VAVTNAYASLADLKAELNIGGADTSYDTKLEMALNAASRQIDGYCGRFFYQDAALTDRTYYADHPVECMVDDISTTTGLVVKVDDDDDGTFETTLTITTNFILLPTNAADMYPVHPYNCIRVVDTGISSFPMWGSGRPGVQVTAKFGWPSVPEDVEKACLVQATQLFKASDAVFGGLSFEAGILRVRDTINPMAAMLLERYCKPRVA